MAHLHITHTTNHHAVSALFDRLGETLHTWHDRQSQRRELASLNDRELQDVGLSSSEALFEASKHFWQA
jgi:uncharacterized protein YjiS (DUF1127 family)